MNRNFIFALILLTTLSIVNAIPHQLHKRTTFQDCANIPSGPVPELDVTISPDPVVSESIDTFTISGILNKDITDGIKLYIAFAVNTENGTVIISDEIVDICKEVACPFKAGTLYQTTQDVYVPKLPDSSFILVSIATGIGKDADVLGCTVQTN